MCNDCLHNFVPYSKSRCLVCSKPIPASQKSLICPACLSKKHYFDKGYSLFNYKEEAVKKIVEFIKFYGYPQLSKILFYFKEYIALLDIFKDCEFIVPVPMHRQDIKKRGYNQSVIISKVISRITGIPVDYNMLSKIRLTKKQVGLSYNERIKNLSGAFRFNHPARKVSRVILIDDVFTTGSTINECSKTLLKNGVKSNFFTFATTPSGFINDS